MSKGRILLAIIVPFFGALLGSVYLFLPRFIPLSPCGFLAEFVPARLLPPNPLVADPKYDALPGAQAYFGELACSGYRIEMPDQWNGDLILYAHGFRGFTTTVTITNLPIRDLAIKQGYAWAASSFRQNGYNPEDGVRDLIWLRDLFKQKFGAPKRIFIYGTSMGGHVVVASLEQYPDLYAGALSECGAVSGVGQFDYLLSYNLLADYFAGVDSFAPGNLSLQAGRALLNEKIYPALGAPASLTEAGKQFRSAAINLSGGHRPFAEEGFADRFSLNMETRFLFIADLTFKRRTPSNVETRYQIDAGLGVDAAKLNEGIRRIAADPTARNSQAHYEYGGFTGKIKTPLLTLHNTGDSFVPIVLEQQYRRLVQAAGAGDLLVQRAVRRYKHCDFTTAERNRAFTDLVNWVGGGGRPEGDDFSGSFADVGRRWTEPLLPDDPGHP